MTSLQRARGDEPRDALSADFLHDLRTPLNQIIGYSEMLTEQAQEEGQAGFLPDLQEIQAAARQLLALLNNGGPNRPDRAPQPAGPIAALSPDEMQPELLIGAAVNPNGSRPPKALILVVDDNYRNRDMLSRRLERQGHAVVTAENGREAMEAVRAQAFDLVLLDIMMPELDGYQVLEQLKADDGLRHIPVIMISALNELDSAVRCIGIGADDYLPKPFDPILLKARIGACLEKKRSHDREMRLFGQCQQNYIRLQELEKLRDDLTHMIIHDLRTPLTSVISGLQTLGVIGVLDEVQREMLDISLGGGETLLGMINDLLDISKIESGSLALEVDEICSADLVASAVGQVARLAESTGLMIVQRVAPGLRPFQGDESKLRRTLVNLLGNAIKFTPAGGSVTVTVTADEPGQHLVFAVSDTGEGIPPEAFDQIFEKFGQVEKRTAGRTNSTGLGLTFCKLAVEAHGGHIQVESVPGEGSVFSFTIPYVATGSPSIAR